MATRRRFSREFKIEAVRLVRERGVSMAQAARELRSISSNGLDWRKRASVLDQASASAKVAEHSESPEHEPMPCAQGFCCFIQARLN